MNNFTLYLICVAAGNLLAWVIGDIITVALARKRLERMRKDFEAYWSSVYKDIDHE